MEIERKVLMVEDDPAAASLYQEVLKSQNFTPIWVENGNQALQKIQKEEFPVILTDLMLPEVDGLSLLRKIRDLYPFTSVIVLTAYATLDAAIGALKGGANGFLKKPFAMDELIRAVQAAYERNFLLKRNQELLEELKAEREYHNMIIQEVASVVVILDFGGNIKKVNPMLARLLGYEASEDLSGRPLEMIFDPEFYKSGWERMIKENHAKETEIFLKNKANKSLRYFFTGTLLKGENGQLLGMVGVLKEPREVWAYVLQLERQVAELKLDQSKP